MPITPRQRYRAAEQYLNEKHLNTVRDMQAHHSQEVLKFKNEISQLKGEISALKTRIAYLERELEKYKPKMA